jgi:hypothetical protein
MASFSLQKQILPNDPNLSTFSIPRTTCGTYAAVAKLLRMMFTMPSALKLAAAAVLLSLAASPVLAQDWAKTRLEASPRHHEYVALVGLLKLLQAM